jgi:drug/metabolite transporter (DMT)-like permease
MTAADFAPVVLGLASAAAWGAGDFCGGLASKRASAYSVVMLSQGAGALLLVGLALISNDPLPPLGLLLWASIGGLAGSMGLLLLYHALASGRMGVAAPLSAVISAALPVAFSSLVEGWPGRLTFAGFALALLGIWLIARSEGAAFRWRDVGLPILAGVGFGIFLIVINRVSHEAVFWPLAASRVTSTVALLSFMLLARQAAGPAPAYLPLIALVGVLDAGGNALFALASQFGRLDVAAVLGSLYPASTVLLAWLILKERISRTQTLGIVAALAAIVLITV